MNCNNFYLCLSLAIIMLWSPREVGKKDEDGMGNRAHPRMETSLQGIFIIP